MHTGKRRKRNGTAADDDAEQQRYKKRRTETDKAEKGKIKMDSVLCFSEEEAEKYISAIGKEYIHFQENNDDGTVMLYLKEGWERTDNGE